MQSAESRVKSPESWAQNPEIRDPSTESESRIKRPESESRVQSPKFQSQENKVKSPESNSESNSETDSINNDIFDDIFGNDSINITSQEIKKENNNKFDKKDKKENIIMKPKIDIPENEFSNFEF